MSGLSHSRRKQVTNGREIMVVHPHDVLSGRGINISQHPGNERFRSLVNARYDESYCTDFTTGEKRALAGEIIAHIQNLDPPGRFLKRLGKAPRLEGPWEEMSKQEVLKKTTQALRDCNRGDRTGYAAQVTVPQDVLLNAEEGSSSGLTLRQRAAAAVARNNTPTQSFDTTAIMGHAEKTSTPSSTVQVSSKTETNCGTSPSSASAVWLRDRTHEESLSSLGAVSHSPHATVSAPYLGIPTNTYSAPMPGMDVTLTTPNEPLHMSSVPVTNTPMQHHPPPAYHSSVYTGHHHPAPGSLLRPPPMLPCQTYFDQLQFTSRSPAEDDPHSRIVGAPAPYSPVVWNRDVHDVGHGDVDDQEDEPWPIPPWNDHHTDDVLRSAADLMNNDVSGQNDFALLGGDDISQEARLSLAELE